MIRVELVLGDSEQQRLLMLEVAPHSNVGDVLHAAAALDVIDASDIESLQVGIFSQAVSQQTAVQQGDRIEVYRPLTIDPKDARRIRAQRQKKR